MMAAPPPKRGVLLLPLSPFFRGTSQDERWAMSASSSFVAEPGRLEESIDRSMAINHQ
jgi:hypothetical protein